MRQMIPWQFRLSLLRAYRLSATGRSTGMIPWKPVWALSARSNARLRCSKAIPRWMCHCLVWKQAENSMEDSITPWIQPWPFQRWTTKAHDAAPKMGKKTWKTTAMDYLELPMVAKRWRAKLWQQQFASDFFRQGVDHETLAFSY